MTSPEPAPEDGGVSPRLHPSLVCGVLALVMGLADVLWTSRAPFHGLAFLLLPLAVLAGVAGCTWGVVELRGRVVSRPIRRQAQLAVAAGVLGLVVCGLLGAALPKLARRTSDEKTLKNLAMALDDYRMIWGRFPPSVYRPPQGGPPQSWRVRIVPSLTTWGGETNLTRATISTARGTAWRTGTT
jgi:hypothetical protein